MAQPPKGIKATEDDIGRTVIYRAGPLWLPEFGFITSIGRVGNVFVRYSGSTSQSTDMNDLDWGD